MKEAADEVVVDDSKEVAEAGTGKPVKRLGGRRRHYVGSFRMKDVHVGINT
jgi:hypothetical protein